MATEKFLSPLVRVPLVVPIFYLASQLGVCHAVQRQSSLTMSTVFPGSDGSGRGSIHVGTQCADPSENETAMGAVVASREAGNSTNQLQKRGEAQRCLLSSSASLMRQQQHLAPEADDFACATKQLMAAAPPPKVISFQKQQPCHEYQSQQQTTQVEEHQQDPDSQQYQTRREAHTDSNAPPNIAFDWRNSFRSAVASNRPQGIEKILTAASAAGEPGVAAIPRKKQDSAAASGRDTEKHQIGFSEALSHATAGEAAALAGGAWDWSTWGLGGLYQSLPSALIKEKAARGTPAANAAEDIKRATAADAEFVVAAAAAPPATEIAAETTAFSVAESPAAAPVETESAAKFVSEKSAAAFAAPPPESRSSAATLPAGSPTAGAFVESHSAAAGEQEHHTSAEAAAADENTSRKKRKESWWGGGETWTETIGSFFRKLDKRIEDAQGVLSHGDMYEFSL